MTGWRRRRTSGSVGIFSRFGASAFGMVVWGAAIVSSAGILLLAGAGGGLWRRVEASRGKMRFLTSKVKIKNYFSLSPTLSP